MKSFTRRFSLMAVLSLIAALTVAGFAAAQDAPFATDEDDSFTWSYEEVEGEEHDAVIYWSLDPEVDCSEPDADDPDAEDNRADECETTEVFDNSGEGLNHGDFVSAFAQDAPEGPGRGCLIAAVATSDAGMPEESTNDNDNDENDENGQKGCPAGLYDWLQTFTGENAGDGPPPWLADKLPAQAGGNGAEAGGGNVPDHVPGPPPGAGPGNGDG